MPADPEILSTVPLFHPLDDDERAAVAALMRPQQIAAGSTIFREDDSGGALYVITRGQVELSVIGEDRQKVTIDVLLPGEFFGEVSLLDGGLRSATAVAVDDVEVICLEREPFLALLERRPAVAVDVLGAVAKRFRKTDALLRQSVRNPNEVVEGRQTLGERVADMVARFGGSWGFIFSFAAVLVVWILLNTVVLLEHKGEPFDPYPFILLNLFLSMLAAIQAPVIMMSQNRQDAKDRIRSELDYQVNLKAELGIIQLHEKFDDLRRDMLNRVAPPELALAHHPRTRRRDGEAHS